MINRSETTGALPLLTSYRMNKLLSSLYVVKSFSITGHACTVSMSISCFSASSSFITASSWLVSITSAFSKVRKVQGDSAPSTVVVQNCKPPSSSWKVMPFCSSDFNEGILSCRSRDKTDLVFAWHLCHSAVLDSS